MEPPAKRLRLLQSVQVDETDADYINARREQDRKFKGRLESVFAKYENMHESMSDIIDIRASKVVVDNGHLRRLARQVNRKETMLLDTLGLLHPREPDGSAGAESEEEHQDSEDELAIEESPRPSRKKKQQQLDIQPQQPALPHAAVHPTPVAPNPAANLLQLVQFPQTPAGQQAQTSFYASLAQTINHAVQQAVAPLFSGILPNTPNVQLPAAIPFADFATPVAHNDKIAPASDPKWYFPPLPDQPQVPQPVATQASIRPELHGEQDAANGESNQTEEKGPESIQGPGEHLGDPPFPVTAIIQSEQQASTPTTKAKRRTSPRVEVQRKPASRTEKKYHFTEEEDIYISRQKVLHQQPWLEIKNGKAHWKDWPLDVFYKRWYIQLKAKQLHLRDNTVDQAERDHSVRSKDELAHSPAHHLPTPSSSGQEDTVNEVDDEPRDPVAHHASSSTHFDQDERELLSLAGADIEEQIPDSVEEEAFLPEEDQVVLPSVESNDFVSEDTLQQELLEGSPMAEVTQHATANIKSESIEALPTRKRRRKQALKAHETLPDSDAEDDFFDAVSTPEQPANSTLACDICGTTFKTTKTLHRHQANPRSAHDNIRPKSASASIDLVRDDDELQVPAPTTPRIKREFSTPPATSFLFSTPAPQSRSRLDNQSSGAKSTSRKAYLKQVKQSWAKKATPGPKTAYKRRSFHSVPRKRGWDGEDSADELGM